VVGGVAAGERVDFGLAGRPQDRPETDVHPSRAPRRRSAAAQKRTEQGPIARTNVHSRRARVAKGKPHDAC
jgi:hypothetical protein